jgi:hypothetical protein
MISESVIIFGVTGNVVMVVNGELPKNAPIMFKVSKGSVELVAADNIVYIEKGLSAYTCQRLKEKNEIGLMEVTNQDAPPKYLTNIAYQSSY